MPVYQAGRILEKLIYKNMRKLIITAIAFATVATGAFAATKNVKENTIDASDSRIEYIGRTLTEGSDVSYDWSGVYMRVRFTGTKLTMKCSDTRGDWFNLFRSTEFSPKEDARFHINSKDTVIVLADGLKKGEHEIILQKRTEGEQGRFTVHSLSCDGEFLQSQRRKERHIEFVGDSYTCGYGTESDNRDEPFKAATENCNLTYATISARYFNADYNLVSHSGQGICRNYDDFRPGYNMPERYRQTFDMSEEEIWDASKGTHRPDLVVIYLCTNDFSTARQPQIAFFAEKYKLLLDQIACNYGKDIPVLCMASKANPLCADYIRYACMMSGLTNASYMSLSDMVHNDTSDLGASWHPNYEGQKKVAHCVIPYIATMTGWELSEKAIR